MRRDPPKLVIRMGIATGEAVVGTIGSASAQSYTVAMYWRSSLSRWRSVHMG